MTVDCHAIEMTWQSANPNQVNGFDIPKYSLFE